MPDLYIRREHQLGLLKARKIAWKWAEDAEAKFDMQCTVLESEDGDTVEFRRSGVSGTLEVRHDCFELNATLGFLLGAFARTIEAEIESNLDKLLGDGAAAAKKKAAPKAAARRKD